MAAKATESIPSASIDELKDYYVSGGYLADQAMRKSLASVKTEKDKTLITNKKISILLLCKINDTLEVSNLEYHINDS